MIMIDVIIVSAVGVHYHRCFVMSRSVCFYLLSKCHTPWYITDGHTNTFFNGNQKITQYYLFDINNKWSVWRNLTLNVRGPNYLGLTRSISWLLMPWLLTSPGHQQPWYRLCSICRSWSYLRTGIKYLCHINMEERHKMLTYVYVHSEKFSM